MKRKCFNCGTLLPYNSLKCKECGYTPNIDFMRKCPNLEVAKCSLTDTLCNHLGVYQTCPVKNKADENF